MSPGELLSGRYRVVRAVAKGGMGAVLEGVDERLRRAVAIKVIRQDLVRDKTLLGRFEREAAAAAAINHPNVLQVFDLDTTGAQPFLVMEWMAGESLASRLRRGGKLEPADAATFTEQALRGLAAAHQAGIVHRDIKPGNLMVLDVGGAPFVKVVDFGIAQLKTGPDFTRLTMTGQIIGTPGYMPPEQLEGGPVAPVTDVYAMGVVLWCLLVGRQPFGTGADVIPRVLAGAAMRADAADASVPRGLADIAERAMQRDPRARFASAHEMADAIAASRHVGSMSAPLARASSVPSVPMQHAAFASGRMSDAGPVAHVVSPPSHLPPPPSPPPPAPLPAGSAPRRWPLYVLSALLIGGLGVSIVAGVLLAGPVSEGRPPAVSATPPTTVSPPPAEVATQDLTRAPSPIEVAASGDPKPPDEVPVAGNSVPDAAPVAGNSAPDGTEPAPATRSECEAWSGSYDDFGGRRDVSGRLCTTGSRVSGTMNWRASPPFTSSVSGSWNADRTILRLRDTRITGGNGACLSTYVLRRVGARSLTGTWDSPQCRGISHGGIDLTR